MINRYVSGLSADISTALKRVVKAARAARWELRVLTADEQSTNPAVYFLTPDYDDPSGGIRVIYRHVDILNAAGINALVLHQKRGFRCSWFENDTRVTDISKVRVQRGDLLVVSELDVSVIKALPRGIRHVIFNQNTHLTWQRHRPCGAAYSASPDLVGVLTVSDHNLAMLRYAYPACRVSRIRISIDPDVFHLGVGERPLRIAYMPRRAHGDATQVLEVLRARGALDGWEVTVLDGLSHRQVAEQLRQARIFLAFTHQEGFGLPAAEAMACGCYVVGNHGFGGSEFFQPEFCSSINNGDITSFAMAIEHALNMDRAQPGWCQERGYEASGFVQSRYSIAAEREDVVAAYREFLQPEHIRQGLEADTCR